MEPQWNGKTRLFPTEKAAWEGAAVSGREEKKAKRVNGYSSQRETKVVTAPRVL